MVEDLESRAMAVERDGTPAVVRGVPGALACATVLGERVVDVSGGGKTRDAWGLSR